MKKNKISIALLSGLLFFSSCSDWLTQENLMGMSEEQTYSEEAGVTSMVSNLYSRMRYWQDFATDGDSYDLTRWDEACNNSQYWAFAGNVDANYRSSLNNISFYDYGFIRELNLHIQNLNTKSVGKIPADKLKYYLAEARYLRAYTYFAMVIQYGGIPLITEVTEYTNDPSGLALPRNKESEIYDFVISELDAIKDDFGSAKSMTRATKGTAMALKCRAALYAGTLAYNYDKSATKNLNLASGATGISKSRAEGYLKACLDAYSELDKLGYQLYQKKDNLADNYYEAFTADLGTNPEIILCKAYDGVNIKNTFTARAIARTQTKLDKSGSQINPVLNIVNDYEMVSTHQKKEMDAYVGEEKLESMKDYTSSYQYNVYDKPEDIFAGRDPRLSATILYPGSTFRGLPIDFQAGLAIPTASGYEFKAATTISGIATDQYEGQKLTGSDGPLCDGDGNWYVSHTGFLLKKFVDSSSGSEINGASKVPYVVFRFGEALLNAAEAAFYLNDLGIADYNGRSTKSLALDCLNRVRQRAGGDAFKLTENELSFERIVNERRVELAFEDHRYNDMKRWRLADEDWFYDLQSKTATITALWPYKIYAPGKPENGKWIYRKVKALHRGNNSTLGFNNTMYYNGYPMNEGNPNIEKNPNH